MAIQPDMIETANSVIRTLVLVLIYSILGLVPGVILGLLAANRMFAKGKPSRIDVHQEKITKAAEHNKQWNPSNERWQK